MQCLVGGYPVDGGKRALEEQHFIEEVGLFFEQTGHPRMAGRILGRLLISVPPHQSTGDLADSLLASKGSISTMTRLLIQVGLIERVSLPGERRDYFRIKPNAWFQMTKQEFSRIAAFRDQVVRGLGILGDEGPGVRERLEELRDMCDFYEAELPGILDRWEQFRAQRKEESIR